MIVIATVPALVALLGAVVYFVGDSPTKTGGKISEVGRIAFACGLLVTLATLVGHVVRL